ncbi:hypothetical protein Z948_2469 [Sulfitobacter donghicola DSW-25 = KCTC 12864 = JCM 14565]|nr:hypothetical protein Z948_2469 [Sulfitobacter donghicola DSW-25 = KCTC 12864 = JCM 14565]
MKTISVPFRYRKSGDNEWVIFLLEGKQKGAVAKCIRPL